MKNQRIYQTTVITDISWLTFLQALQQKQWLVLCQVTFLEYVHESSCQDSVSLGTWHPPATLHYSYTSRTSFLYHKEYQSYIL